MKILVTCSNYPDLEGSTNGMFFHVRNLHYSENEIQVDVLNFGTDVDYCKEGINVYSYDSYKTNLINNDYDLLICHAPHISHHYKFIKQFQHKYKKIVFIFHGNEVFKVNKILSTKYSFVQQSKFRHRLERDIKDEIKLLLWRKLFINLSYKTHFIFVSNWMYEQFLLFTGMNRELISDNHYIIYNSIGRPFELNNYNETSPKIYDFITIRNNLDDSKYGIDIVNNLAKNNPQFKFLVIGKGTFFNHYKRSENLEWIEKELSHQEIVDYLNKSYCGLLPTRWDSQGLMTCEFASFGIPTITSDIPICHEVLDDFSNVAFIDNDNSNLDLGVLYERLKKEIPYPKNYKYFATTTSGKEIELFNIISGANKEWVKQ